ncbi:MAG TPA: alpha/beta fold hydrolase, partial [Longimicrobiales bacterium]|nr:alpha/beta fold hydrolase [Longimicrobiales bacterium]
MTRGLGLSVRTSGRGSPVVLLHGFTGSSGTWDSWILHGLSDSFRVLAVDLPGHGGSPDPPEDYSVKKLVRDLGRLLEREGLERAAWIGYSMGGRMALAQTILAPESVDRVVLESASPGLSTEAERAARRESDRKLASRIRSRGMEAFVEEWMAQPFFRT